MKTVIVPLDGSPLAEQALPYAKLLAKTLDARIELLRVIPDIERENILVDSMATMYVGEHANSYHERDRQLLEDVRSHAEGYLESQAESLRMAGLEFTTMVRFGPPAEVIVETAAALESAVIVMATHGYSGIQRWALGSVADKVIHATTVPVLLIRGQTVARAVEPGLRSILVPLDGSTLAEQALPIATDLARRADAKLVLLHAVDPLLEVAPNTRGLGARMAHSEQVLHDLVGDSERQLREIGGTIDQVDMEIVPMALVGYPAEVIVDEAERRHVDLVVMVTHGYSGLRRWALGSTADKVLHSTRTPLLLLRARSN